MGRKIDSVAKTIGAEDREKETRRLELEDMRDTFFVRGELPCPRYLGTRGGLTVEQVKAWTTRYLSKSESPLQCIRVAACMEVEVTQDRGVVGCWGLTVSHRNGTFLAPASPCVQQMAKRLKAEAIRGRNTGTTVLRVLCQHSHGGTA